MVREVDSITASDLHRRLSGADGQDEVSHLAQRFNRLLDRLETAFAGQRTFVRDASHELRTPLTALIGELEVALMQQQRTPQEYRRVLASTLDAARLLNDLTNGLLQIARASDDLSQVPRTRVRLERAAAAGPRGSPPSPPYPPASTWSLGNHPRGARGGSRSWCAGNEALLLAAFLNVLENACKFSAHAPQPVLAILTALPGAVRLQVRDQGQGMSEADRQQVFLPFFRAANARASAGHGIGLPLTARIMELHGGSVRVESELGVGTQVWLEMPTDEK